MLLQHCLLWSHSHSWQMWNTLDVALQSKRCFWRRVPCGYLMSARSGWGLFPLLRSHRKEESRAEMDEQDEEVELLLGWGVGRLFLLLIPWWRKEAAALDARVTNRSRPTSAAGAPREKTQKKRQTIVIILNADPDGYNRSRYKVGGDCVKLKYIMGENVKLCTKITSSSFKSEPFYGCKQCIHVCACMTVYKLSNLLTSTGPKGQGQKTQSCVSTTRPQFDSCDVSGVHSWNTRMRDFRSLAWRER